MSLLDLIKFSSALKRKAKVGDCVKAIKEKLAEIPDLNEFRDTDELCEIVCNVVEAMLAKKAAKYRINKQEVVLTVYNELFQSQPLSDKEKEVLKKRIDYLCEKGLVHGVAFSKWATKALVNWLKKKML